MRLSALRFRIAMIQSEFISLLKFYKTRETHTVAKPYRKNRLLLRVSAVS